MKRLTRIKLIHWHYFINDTININGSLLLTGENGSGKSTILDAIQFALVADHRKVRFNVSAHEETKRDLRGYIRGKTGSDTEVDPPVTSGKTRISHPTWPWSSTIPGPGLTF